MAEVHAVVYNKAGKAVKARKFTSASAAQARFNGNVWAEIQARQIGGSWKVTTQ